MKKRLVYIVAVAVLALLLMKLLGSIQFTPSMTDRLVEVAAWFGRHDEEAVEDFFFLSATLLSILLSLLIVRATSFALSRWAGKTNRS